MRFCDLPLVNGSVIKCGNHTKTPATGNPGEIVHNYLYYWTVICQTIVRGTEKLFWVSTNGYGSVSTKHAIARYRNNLIHMGWTEIAPPEWVRT